MAGEYISASLQGAVVAAQTNVAPISASFYWDALNGQPLIVSTSLIVTGTLTGSIGIVSPSASVGILNVSGSGTGSSKLYISASIVEIDAGVIAQITGSLNVLNNLQVGGTASILAGSNAQLMLGNGNQLSSQTAQGQILVASGTSTVPIFSGNYTLGKYLKTNTAISSSHYNMTDLSLIMNSGSGGSAGEVWDCEYNFVIFNQSVVQANGVGLGFVLASGSAPGYVQADWVGNVSGSNSVQIALAAGTISTASLIAAYYNWGLNGPSGVGVGPVAVKCHLHINNSGSGGPCIITPTMIYNGTTFSICTGSSVTAMRLQ